MKGIIAKSILLGATCIFASSTLANDRFANVEVKAEKVAGSVYMLTGAGGNIGVSSGEDGVLMIDDQFAPLAEKIVNTLATLNDNAPKYLINTHYHGDHTGSNAFFKDKHDTTIFAHENVRIRLASGENAQKSALPVVTYQDGIKFYLNDETIHVIHLAKGHTDGDSVIWFENANAVHMGDLYFHNRFPYIDLGAGGTVAGYIEAVETIIAKVNDDTKIMPGHGPLSNKTELKSFVEMIKDTYLYVQTKKTAGQSEDEVLKAGLDEKWNDWSWGFINEERWIKTLYQ